MPNPLANPFTFAQLNDTVRNAVISWQKGAAFDEQKSLMVRSLFGEQNAANRTEEFSNMSDSGFSSKTGEAEDYQLVTTTQGDSLTLTQVKRSARKKISEDLLEFNKYPQVAASLKNVGGYLWRGYALDLSHRFTFAFDTSYVDRDGDTITTTGGDTAALCANTHTMNDGSTYDNLNTSRLSESGLEDAEDLGRVMIDHNGQLVTPSFDKLITGTHASTSHMAQRLTGQPMQTDTEFNNISVYSGKYSHIQLPYLDTTASGATNSAKYRFWFVADSAMAKQNLIASVRAYPDLEQPTVDPDNNTVQFKAKMWYDIGHLDGNFIVGNNAV